MPEAAPSSPATARQPATAGSPRLRAVTRRVPRRPASPADGEEGDGHPDEAAPEPNIRLTRALGVMLLLHLVAAGGVLAFASIKERPVGTGKLLPAKVNRTNPRVAPAPGAGPTVPPGNAPTPYPATSAPSAVATPAAASAGAGAGRATPTPALSRVEADAVRLIEGGGPNPTGGGERAYVVGRGETVQTIAQKLRVEPAALLRLNGIDDPRKIQAGQRLRVPAPPGRSRP